MALATGFGSGLLKPGPGTWGTALGCVLAPALWHVPAYWAWGGVFVFAVAGIFICERAIALFGHPDPGCVVFDEVVAIWMVALALPHTAGGLVAGFVLFRVFDIAKPWPICQAERLPGGWGVMADDIVAALFSVGVYFLAVLGMQASS